MYAVNINRDLTDIFCRYKMPPITVKFEGKGNGIKTVIVNMVEIAKNINRPPTYPVKYFAYKLGIQTQTDQKNQRFILNGYHDAYKLQDLLACFIRKYVLCLRCDNPETNLSVQRKKGVIYQNCRACGFYDILKMEHKLTKFIVQNPPDLWNLPAARKCSRRDKNTCSGNAILNTPAFHVRDVETTYDPTQAAHDVTWISDVTKDGVLGRMLDLTKDGFASKLLQTVDI